MRRFLSFSAFLAACLSIVVCGVFPHGPLSNPGYCANDEAPEEDWTDDGAFDGFGDADSGDVFMDTGNLDVEAVDRKKLTIGGYIEEKIDYGFQQDDPDFTKIMTRAGIDAKLEIADKWKARFKGYAFYDYAYEYLGREDFTDEVLEEHEFRADIEELYIDGYIRDWLHLRIGRQITAWGDTEGDQIIDVVNSRNRLEPGILDVEDSREAATLSQISLITEKQRLTLMAIHEIRTHRMAPEGSVFDPYQAYRGAGVVIGDGQTPKDGLRIMEFLARFSWSLAHGDIHFSYANVYDDMPCLDFDGITPAGLISLTPRHKRIRMYGVNGNYVTGPLVFKAEVAYKTGRGFERSDMEAQYMENQAEIRSYEERDTLQGMVGVEYNGISELYATLELVGEKIRDHENYLITGETSEYATLILTHEAMRDTLDTELILSYYPDDNETLLKLVMTYDITDSWSVNAGVVVYESADEEGLLYPYRRNDRIMSGIKYGF